MKTPNYLRVIRRMLDRGEIAPGEVSEATIEHDDWCDQLHGRGWCNCNPRVTVVRQPKGGPRAS